MNYGLTLLSMVKKLLGIKANMFHKLKLLFAEVSHAG
jgi:hypothetical protein